LFAGFHVTTAVYKKVDGHEITLNVLVPKGVHLGNCHLLFDGMAGSLYNFHLHPGYDIV
jgi:hypothetical protein